MPPSVACWSTTTQTGKERLRCDLQYSPDSLSLGANIMLASMDFSEPIYVVGRASIADLFKPKHRCGIYVLHFANGDFYVGQAVDVTRRFVQHRKIHTDIEKIAFKRVARSMLSEEEHSAIWRLERNDWPLRNIRLTSFLRGESDFDLIMSPEDQARWLEDLSYVDLEGDRAVNPTLRSKYTTRYHQRFKRMPHADAVIDVLRSYVRGGIPAIRRGEISFWACSCLPARDMYLRININWQEVLTILEADNEVHFSLHLALSPLDPGKALSELFHTYPKLALTADDTDDAEGSLGQSIISILKENPEDEISPEHTSKLERTLKPLFEIFPNLIIEDQRYEPGGQDQIRLIVSTADEALRLLQFPEVRKAIRLLNLRLMQRGPSNWGQNHCLDLADAILRDET